MYTMYRCDNPGETYIGIYADTLTDGGQLCMALACNEIE